MLGFDSNMSAIAQFQLYYSNTGPLVVDMCAGVEVGIKQSNLNLASENRQEEAVGCLHADGVHVSNLSGTESLLVYLFLCRFTKVCILLDV